MASTARRVTPANRKSHLVDNNLVLLRVLIDQMLVDELGSLEELQTICNEQELFTSGSAYEQPWRY